MSSALPALLALAAASPPSVGFGADRGGILPEAARGAIHRPDLLASSRPEEPDERELDSTRESPGGSNPWTVALVSAGFAGAVLTVGTIAWWDRGFDAFRFNDTGFFGRETYAGGADKLGHFFSAYVSMCAMTSIYEELGISRDGAVLGATLFTMLLWNGFELIDGFTDYGVEHGDIVMNTLGIGAGAAIELFPAVERTIGFRLGYVPSRDFLAHDKTFLKFINDYTGMTFYGDVKLKGVFDLAGVSPGPLRFVVTGPVYSTGRYSPVRVHEERRRNLGLHVGVSLAEVLRAIGDGDPGVEAQARFFDFYAVPFLQVAAIRDLNQDQWFISFGVSNRGEIAL